LIFQNKISRDNPSYSSNTP